MSTPHSLNSFNSLSKLQVGKKLYSIFRLAALKEAGFKNIDRLPFSLRILLENLLRCEDGKSVVKDDIAALANWDAKAKPSKEIAFKPARVLLQDFTGVPAVVDLAAMREAIKNLGGDPKKINPLSPADLVIDHSVQIDSFGTAESLHKNADLEFKRNQERYQFLRWGQQAFDNFRVVPPDTGIVHQVNLEYLASVVFSQKVGKETYAYPDTLVGTDSHTTMINGLGVLGWGVGGIEAEAALLGQSISMLIPQVVGFRLYGELRAGTTATDLVLTVTQMLRAKGVVGKLVEFYGEAYSKLSLPDRATLANMAPEYGATAGFCPVDEKTVQFLRLTGRREAAELVEVYCKEQGFFCKTDGSETQFSDTLSLDLSTVESSIAGPKRPQDRINLRQSKSAFRKALHQFLESKMNGVDPKVVSDWIEEGGALDGTDKSDKHHALAEIYKKVSVTGKRGDYQLAQGSVVIASITSCTNTSNPSVLIAAGILAKKATERGLKVPPWVKTSLAPGSQVVTEYLKKSGLLRPLEELGFYVVGYGCATCIGNSGPLPEEVAFGIEHGDLVAVSVLSGNRNFEGRIHPLVKANYLASPPLVVAYALAGKMDFNFATDSLGTDSRGKSVFLKDLWPNQEEINAVVSTCVTEAMFEKTYADVFKGDVNWQSLEFAKGDTFLWDEQSTYVKNPPFFQNMSREVHPIGEIKGARVLALLGDSVTTDHISPAGNIPIHSPAGKYLIAHGVEATDFNSFGSRRGNHEVMMRGTFGNIRLRNQLAPGTEGGVTLHLPDGKQTSIYEASMQYQKEGVSLVVLAGKEYGTGSSRDWAAKGTRLLGVRAVIAESFERIHRSNLVGMGILPLQFAEGQSWKGLGLSGREIFSIEGLSDQLKPLQTLQVLAEGEGTKIDFEVTLRIDTPDEIEYYRHGGILQYVLRQLLDT